MMGISLFILISLGITWFVLYAIIAIKRQNAHRNAILEGLGFSPVANQPAAFVEYITTLHHHVKTSKPRLKLEHVFQQRIGNADVYVFKLIDNGSEHSKNYEVVAYVSPSLRLPRFWLNPVLPTKEAKPDENSAIFRVLNSMFRYNRKVEFPDVPEFEMRYTLLITDEQDDSEIQNTFTPPVIAGLLNSPSQYSMLGWGDTLTERSRLKITTKTTIEEAKAMLEDTLSLFLLFENQGASSTVNVRSLDSSVSRNLAGKNDIPAAIKTFEKSVKIIAALFAISFLLAGASFIFKVVSFQKEQTASQEEAIHETPAPPAATPTPAPELPPKLPELTGFACAETNGHLECVEPITGMILVNIPVAQSDMCGAKTEFWLGKYEVTQEEWEKLMGTNPSFFNRSKLGDGYKRHPVEQVSWDDAQAFLQVLNSHYKDKGVKFDLPSTPQYQRGCQAGMNADWPYGTRDASKLEAYAYHNGNALGSSHIVGEKAGNVFGLHDVIGNVYEWSRDTNFTVKITDGNAEFITDKDNRKDLLGGSWNTDPDSQRCTMIPAELPSARRNDIGFRVAVEPF